MEESDMRTSVPATKHASSILGTDGDGIFGISGFGDFSFRIASGSTKA
jgi:hypothetical protein